MVSIPTDPVLLVAALLATAIAVVAFVYGWRELRIARHVLRSGSDSALDATDGGPIELVGTARTATGTVRSPFTDTHCLVCEYAIEEERHSRHGRSWERIAAGDESVPFLLETDDGSVLVEPPGADLRLETERRIAVEAGTAPPEPIQRYLDRTEGVDSQDRSLSLGPLELRTGNDRRFVERRLDAGEEVYVLGTARYDTTVGRRAGQVNAAVGVDRTALSGGRLAWLRYALFGYPFVVSDRPERSIGLRAGVVGAVAVAVGVLALSLVAVVVTA